MRKIRCMLLALLFLLGCAPALDPQYDKDAVIAAAETFILELNERSYDDCADRFNPLMAAQFDAQLLEAAVGETLDRAGGFQEFTKATATSATSGMITYAVVVLTARYDNGSIRYTVTLDPDLTVAGFFLK